MKKFYLTAAVLGLLASPAFASDHQKAPQSDNANNRLASERAERNSITGDRNPNNSDGNFGQLQSDAAKQYQPYGQWLNENGWTGSSDTPNPPSQ